MNTSFDYNPTPATTVHALIQNGSPVIEFKPYTPEFYQGLIGYVRHFNTVVETVDGPGILRNFYYSEISGEINGLEVEMPVDNSANGDYCAAPRKLVTYNFGQVNLVGIGKRAPVFSAPTGNCVASDGEWPGHDISKPVAKMQAKWEEDTLASLRDKISLENAAKTLTEHSVDNHDPHKKELWPACEEPFNRKGGDHA